MTTFDYFLLFLGSAFAIVAGAGWPLILIVFGDMVNTFIFAENSPFAQNNSGNFSSGIATTEILSFTSSSGETSIETISMEDFQSKVIQNSLQYVSIACAVLVASYIQVACWVREFLIKIGIEEG